MGENHRPAYDRRADIGSKPSQIRSAAGRKSKTRLGLPHRNTTNSVILFRQRPSISGRYLDDASSTNDLFRDSHVHATVAREAKWLFTDIVAKVYERFFIHSSPSRSLDLNRSTNEQELL